MTLPRLVSALVVMLFLQATAMHATEIASCTFTTFSAPAGYTFWQINGVGDDGTVVGQLLDNKTGQYVGFSYSSSGVFTEYTAPKSMMTWFYGENASGTTAGYYQDIKYPGHLHGLLLQGKEMTEVNYPGADNTWVFDINQVGGMAGSFSKNPASTKGFVYTNGEYTTLAYPKAQVTWPYALNDNGAVVGSYASDAFTNGFLWENGKFTTINLPGAKYGTVLSGINNSGVIVGDSFDADVGHGFIYENGTFEKIEYSGAKFATAGGINNNGLISGQIYFTLGDTLGYTAVCK